MNFCRCQTSAIVIKKDPHIIKPYQNLEKFAQLTLFKSKTFSILMTIFSNLFIRSWPKVIHPKYYKHLLTGIHNQSHCAVSNFYFILLTAKSLQRQQKYKINFEFLQYLRYKVVMAMTCKQCSLSRFLQLCQQHVQGNKSEAQRVIELSQVNLTC